MSSSRVDYIPPWWTFWLHSFPRYNLELEPVDNDFEPSDWDYLQSLVFLSCTAAVVLGVNLLCLAVYLSCLCCRRKDDDGDSEVDSKKTTSRCVTWSAVTAGLVTCVAVGVGFYGNSETNDGIYQVTYSIYNVNNTVSGLSILVNTTKDIVNSKLKQHLDRLEEIFAISPQYVQTLQVMKQIAQNVVQQLVGLPDLSSMNVASIANLVANVEYYRWLGYLLLLTLDLAICLLACLGLAKQSRGLLTTMMVCGVLTLIISWVSLGAELAAAVGISDFCVAPDKFITSKITGLLGTEIIHYYVYCNQTVTNPWQKPLTDFQRSLTTMETQIQNFLQIAVPLFPTAEKDLLGIQNALNSSETSLHQLTALLDCKGLNKDYRDTMMGICYDGVEGLLYLCLFSVLAACAFTIMLFTIPRAWRQIARSEQDYNDMDEEDPFNPRRNRRGAQNQNNTTLHSLCSYSSSMGSQNSLQPPAPPLSSAPIGNYMNQTALFGGNPRYENVPLIGRGSPPPSIYSQQYRNRYSPSMRATYLAVTEEQRRHFGNDFQV
ncbi:protein tweety homolog 2 isoform X3 [Corythoichthys intestinalis]|uniref:protein tweety homolog 2 isoform X3 n=1 Tax=Corythoichthys intestinalis TaxID=161448 RepID=UPI0025A5349E|nr:protein tweety homolog 2 isoform X3 [Corythoichthys intestinalis]